jgi:ParB/RepB/Spo0J family partition protein
MYECKSILPRKKRNAQIQKKTFCFPIFLSIIARFVAKNILRRSIMAKMGSGTGLRKIPLSQIVDTGNVRVDYKEIEELAESIKIHGQLEAALVKTYEPDGDGEERFEIVAGHRRRLAIQLLHDKGENFTTIDAVLVQGDKLTLQLVENLQRSDLTAAERERGIYQMCKNGLSQKEVASRLSKDEVFVSRNVSAYKIREAANAAGIDTTTLATGTLNEIQAAKAADYPALVNEILQSGGTLTAARAVMENYRVAHGKPANPKAKNKGGISDPLELHPSPAVDPIVEEFSESGVDVDIDIDTSAEATEPTEKAHNEKQTTKAINKKAIAERSWLDEFEPPPHKQVDFNTVCISILNYAKESEAIVKNCEFDETADCDTCAQRCIDYYKLEVSRDIIALLHASL